MLLSESQIRRSVTFAQSAFPHVANWKHINEVDDHHTGFCLWGRFVLQPDRKYFPPRFFITFSAFGETWTGSLSVGKYRYFWSSADVGDALLLETHPCATLECAIAALKELITQLFAALSDGADSA